MQTGKIGVTSENLFPIIKKFLYSDHDIFLREIISNAVDATQKLKTLASKDEYTGDVTNAKVKVKLDTNAKTITVSDNGIGMTAEEIEKYINQIAFSGANDFLEKYKTMQMQYWSFWTWILQLVHGFRKSGNCYQIIQRRCKSCKMELYRKS
jgi:molecular chaperone HtpG